MKREDRRGAREFSSDVNGNYPNPAVMEGQIPVKPLCTTHSRVYELKKQILVENATNEVISS